MTEPLDYVDVLRDLIPIVAENPDKVTDPADCIYFDAETHKPSCLVGHWLAKRGVTRDDLRYEDSNGYTCDANDSTAWAKIAAPLPFLYTEEADALLTAVQKHQDKQLPWSTALRKAVEEVHPRPKP